MDLCLCSSSTLDSFFLKFQYGRIWRNKKDNKVLQAGDMVLHFPLNSMMFVAICGQFKIIKRLGTNSYIADIDGVEV
eukprot:snap_masked-scaffold_3-processed-gene-1.33-mRNA-1 protein AED:1.00 eAED:1.00 QI:0/-1/0/0/-1/1/1/0/76